MGKDKSELYYHGKPQKEFVKKLLEEERSKTHYSVQVNNKKEHEKHFHLNNTAIDNFNENNQNHFEISLFNLWNFKRFCSFFNLVNSRINA